MTDFTELWDRAQKIIQEKIGGSMTEYERSDLIMRLAMYFDNQAVAQGQNVMCMTKPPIPEQDTDNYHFTEKGKFPKSVKCKQCGKVLSADKSSREPGTYYYRCGECKVYTNPSVSGVE